MKFDHLIKNIIEEKKVIYANQNIILTQEQINILNCYHIHFETCHSLQELIFCIEEVLESGIVDESLEKVSESLSEYNYYQNYKK